MDSKSSRLNQETSPFTAASILSKVFFWYVTYLNRNITWSKSIPNYFDCNLENIHIFSILRWLNPFLSTGSKRNINREDLYKISSEAESQALGNKLEFEWNKELEKRQKSYEVGALYNPNLTKAIIRAFLPGFLIWGISALFVDIVFRIPQPLLMCWFIRYFSSDDHAGLTYANVCYYGAGIILMSALCTITNHQYFFGVNKTGMMLRVAHCSIIYRKVFQN